MERLWYIIPAIAVSHRSHNFPVDPTSEHRNTLRQHSTMPHTIDLSSRPRQLEEGGGVPPSADIRKQKQSSERKRGKPLQLEHLTPEQGKKEVKEGNLLRGGETEEWAARFKR